MRRYLPVVPLVLLNGAEGIGTGWSTFIPNYSPREVVANLRALLAGGAQTPLQPCYAGFKGTIQEVPSKTAGRSYAVHGTIAQVLISSSALPKTRLPHACACACTNFACHWPRMMQVVPDIAMWYVQFGGFHEGSRRAFPDAGMSVPDLALLCHACARRWTMRRWRSRSCRCASGRRTTRSSWRA